MNHLFCYGSNMCRRRLWERVPSATYGQTGFVRGFVLEFHKRSTSDGSGKASLARTGNPEDVVWGVVAVLNAAGKRVLDHHEGSGYSDKRVTVYLANGGTMSATAYVATDEAVEDGLVPFSWYRDLLIAGAREHGVPSRYVDLLAAVEAYEDPDRMRDASYRRLVGHTRHDTV